MLVMVADLELMMEVKTQKELDLELMMEAKKELG